MRSGSTSPKWCVAREGEREGGRARGVAACQAMRPHKAAVPLPCCRPHQQQEPHPASPTPPQVHSIMRHVAETTGSDLEELYRSVAWPLYK